MMDDIAKFFFFFFLKKKKKKANGSKINLFYVCFSLFYINNIYSTLNINIKNK